MLLPMGYATAAGQSGFPSAVHWGRLLVHVRQPLGDAVREYSRREQCGFAKSRHLRSNSGLGPPARARRR